MWTADGVRCSGGVEVVLETVMLLAEEGVDGAALASEVALRVRASGFTLGSSIIPSGGMPSKVGSVVAARLRPFRRLLVKVLPVLVSAMVWLSRAVAVGEGGD